MFWDRNRFDQSQAVVGDIGRTQGSKRQGIPTGPTKVVRSELCLFGLHCELGLSTIGANT